MGAGSAWPQPGFRLWIGRVGGSGDRVHATLMFRPAEPVAFLPYLTVRVEPSAISGPTTPSAESHIPGRASSPVDRERLHSTRGAVLAGSPAQEESDGQKEGVCRPHGDQR